jgi:MarR-like DNA-binding transcriptional regulator SgrR of sgrS sRNA
MTDMTTTTTEKPSVSPADQSKTDKSSSVMVTLEQLASELKMSPRDARMLLRLAAKQTKQYPNLGKDHVARQPWQWTPGSKALEEARKALKTPA